MKWNIIIFSVTYIGIAIGGFPGLAVDRTGIALLGAIAMVVTGAVSAVDAVHAIDINTLLLLYGLMVISAQFRMSGLYARMALFIAHYTDRPGFFLSAVMITSALLSALLTNDIICLTFTPVLTVALLKKNLNPVPFLIALAVSSNIGSAATIIGNPQNMLIGQTGHLSFGYFTAWCIVPTAASLIAARGIIGYLYRNNYTLTGLNRITISDTTIGSETPHKLRQSIKGLLILLISLIMFFTSVPREITVTVAAGLLLLSRTTRTVELLGFVDWQLITLFCGLFIVIQGITITGLPEQSVQWLLSHGISVNNHGMLSVITMLLSNIVSNVPAVMLIVPHLDPAQPTVWYTLALASTFAGNLITIGSIANLITFELAAGLGVKISFREHARCGIPVTVASCILLGLWLAL